MKILHVVPTYLPATRYGGPIYSVHGLCKALASEKTAVSVYTTSVDGNSDSDVEHAQAYTRDNVEVFYFKSNYLRRIYFSNQLKTFLQDTVANYDLLHLHSIFLYRPILRQELPNEIRCPMCFLRGECLKKD